MAVKITSDADPRPAMLIFGSLADFPSEEAFAEARHYLTTNRRLAAFKKAIEELPSFWRDLVQFDPATASIPAEEYFDALTDWVTNDEPLLYDQDKTPTVYSFTVCFIVQIAQYVGYLDRMQEKLSHQDVLEGLQGGVQGFCTGFLSALVIATSRDELELGKSAASMLRLAVCIGANVDIDGRFAATPKPFGCVSARWKPDDKNAQEDVRALIRSFYNTHVSASTDKCSLTITAPVEETSALIKALTSRGVRAKKISVHGRFHAAAHAGAAEKLLSFSALVQEPLFASRKPFHTSVRSTVTGENILKSDLARLALENTLTAPADWYGTLKQAFDNLPEHSSIGIIGAGNQIPPSLLLNRTVETFNLNISSRDELETPRDISLTLGGLTNGFSAQRNGPSGASPASQISVDPEIAAAEEKLGVKLDDLASRFPPHSIAIVGMAGKFPGADDLDELWDLIMAEKVMVEKAPTTRLGLQSLAATKEGKQWFGNFIKDSDAFDHKFFKKSSREAIAWDPQQRILMEITYQALEDAGYFGIKSAGAEEPKDYGCYIGACMNNYYDNLSCSAPTAYGTVGTSRCYFSGIVSHNFGWTGPALTIDTACSSSLVAINTACRAIWSGECSRAIAGGTNVICSPFDYSNLNAAGFLSPTGQCKPFDGSGDGYCRGEGVAVVVLKPLAAAIAEHDDILGVITGSSANQNYNDSHITVPHSGSQIELYRTCMDMAGVTPESVSYVEAHGTGTGVGDPVEARSIRGAFGGPQRDSQLYFSSIKGNVGHTEATAGVAGLVKVLMMMRHGKIPPQASHKSLNPKIPSLEVDKMTIPRQITDWDAKDRIACVNSYGAAGSNSALLVREGPWARRTPSKVSTSIAALGQSKLPVLITAASVDSMASFCRRLGEQLHGVKDLSAATIPYHLANRANHSLDYVLSTTVKSFDDLKEQLANVGASSGTKISRRPTVKPVVLVFGGQESSFCGLSRELFESSPNLKYHLEECHHTLELLEGKSLIPAIFQRESISDLVVLHASFFATQYAAAKAWMDSGLKVEAVIGHSFGQLTALCLSGALSLQDAMKLVTGRARLMQKLWGKEKGSMIFVQASSDYTKQILQRMEHENSGAYAEIACYNGPTSHVVVGADEAIDAVEKLVAQTPLNGKSVRSKKLDVTNGFHSVYTEVLLKPLGALAATLDWKEPTIRLETTTAFQNATVGPNLVTEHTRGAVHFQEAVERLSKDFSGCTWLEAGRGSSVIELVKGCVPDKSANLFLSPRLTAANALDSLAESVTELWSAGSRVQFWPFDKANRADFQDFSLPPYQFEKTRHFLQFTSRGVAEEPKPVAAIAEPERDELLTLVEGDALQKATFRISASSERFQDLCGGHVMSGQALAPASLYFEVAALAALQLQGDITGATWVPTMSDLIMKSPIGLDTDVTILMVLQRVKGTAPSWSFEISLQTAPIAGRKSEPYSQSTGTIHLKERSDTSAARKFKRFEKLTGRRRYDEIMSEPDAERMQGKHVYRAFNHIVHYGPAFRGIKSVACDGLEAVGKVVITPDACAPAGQRLVDTPMTDSFMQFAGFLVNYFNNPHLEDVLYVCHHIEHVEIGGKFTPDRGEWIIYSNMTEDGEGHCTADAYVFDPESGEMVMAAFGFHFAKMSQSKLARLLQGVNKQRNAGSAAKPVFEDTFEIPTVQAIAQPATVSNDSVVTQQSASMRGELFKILSNVTDIPVSDLSDQSTLDELGIDSLGATEVLNDVRTGLGLTIDLSSFLFFANLGEIVAHVDKTMGIEVPTASQAATASKIATSGAPPAESEPAPPSGELSNASGPEELPTIDSAHGAFEEIKNGWGQHEIETKARGYWSDSYPGQERLVLAYVQEAWAKLGCNLNDLSAGEAVPMVKGVLARHQKLMHQLYRVLEHGRLIIKTGENEYVRSNVPVSSKAAERIYQEIIPTAGQSENATVVNLVKAIGSQLAECLTGKDDGLQIIFGNRKNKKDLEEFYEKWPLFNTATYLLGDFLRKAFTDFTGSGKFRILEIGAGTGGTTRHLLKILKSHAIQYEYTFSDISTSLLGAAKKTFKNEPNMKFEVVDIENAPEKAKEGAYHVILATNCIHATKNLEKSLRHLRQMLREDGALTLVEITQNIFFFDIIVGLFEGWWLFDDGRTHALVDEIQWSREMRAAGFESVQWTNGDAPESKTVRVIGAFPTAPATALESKKIVPQNTKASVEEVVYKKLGDRDVLADIYCPVNADASKKLPIALMIHGGSHIIFSRKDIRPAQTRHLLSEGYLPVSLDHRLCPEAKLAEGGMIDICDALEWARNTLPSLRLKNPDVRPDGNKVVVIGWSSGGQLAMSLAWTAPLRALRPPEAILAFYCPTDYEDPWWRSPIQPIGAENKGYEYDLLEAIQDEPITNYGIVGAWEPLSDPRIRTDPRCRIVLHINWKAQTLPVIIGGLPSKRKAAELGEADKDWQALEQPTTEQIVPCSPLAQIRRGNYNTPTFLVHGTADDLIPWEQSQRTHKALLDRGVNAQLALVRDGPHICDLSSDPNSEGWKAVMRGYDFIKRYVA